MNLDSIIETYNIQNLFDTLPSFSIKTFEKNEIMVSPVFPLQQFYLVIKGVFCVYSIRADGSYRSISLNNEMTLLGDIEFVNHVETNYYVEAKTDVTALCFDMSEKLRKDISFLNYLNQCLAKKLQMSTQSIADFDNLEDKLVYYMKNVCENNTLTDIGQSALKLQCSRRQLQRVLSKLVETNKIVKLKKGSYKLL